MKQRIPVRQGFQRRAASLTPDVTPALLGRLGTAYKRIVLEKVARWT